MKMWEVWNEIMGRLPSGLSPTEQVVNRVNNFLFNFDCGGWLYNLSPATGTGETWAELPETAECVAAVGDLKTARQLQQVVRIVETASIQTSGTWSEFLATVDPSDRIKQIENEISDEIPQLWDKLRDYTAAHFDCERD
jgi:hypothetical protein